MILGRGRLFWAAGDHFGMRTDVMLMFRNAVYIRTCVRLRAFAVMLCAFHSIAYLVVFDAVRRFVTLLWGAAWRRRVCVWRD